MRKPTAEHVYSLIEKLSKEDRQSLAKMIAEKEVLLTWEVMEASVFNAMLSGYAKDNQILRGLYEQWKRLAGSLQEQLNRRTRKSGSAIVKRNAEICALRMVNPKTWTLGKLAQKYRVTRQYIVKIIKEEQKWIRLSDRL
jgi:hypothetical protein